MTLNEDEVNTKEKATVERCTSYFKTENMHSTENKLLSECVCPGNVQKESNAQPSGGYVYVIAS